MAIPTQSTAGSDVRREAIQSPALAKVIVLVPGVELRPLAGAHNGAQNLFTGLLTLAPRTSYPLYTRQFDEVLILLEGEGAVDVEERRYGLGLLDSISIRVRQPRRVVNLSTSQYATFHVALASSVPDQTWINGRFTPVAQPPGSSGRSGSEQIRRNDCAARIEAAPRASFRDLFDAELGMHGICGGQGLFEPGARLPCHRHEFDESITVVEGTATCVVEGHRYELSGNATALIPQGRCHYVINLTLDPMVMISVYAGHKPEWTVMDEAFCHPERVKGK